MLNPGYWARWSAVCVAVAVLLGLGGAARAAVVTQPPCQNCPRPGVGPGNCPSGCMCTPNLRYWGHFEKQWRPWPVQQRPDIEFPQGIGVKGIQTPKGTVPPIPPKEEYPPPRSTTGVEGLQIQQGPSTAPETPFRLEPGGAPGALGLPPLPMVPEGPPATGLPIEGAPAQPSPPLSTPAQSSQPPQPQATQPAQPSEPQPAQPVPPVPPAPKANEGGAIPAPIEQRAIKPAPIEETAPAPRMTAEPPRSVVLDGPTMPQAPVANAQQPTGPAAPLPSTAPLPATAPVPRMQLTAASVPPAATPVSALRPVQESPRVTEGAPGPAVAEPVEATTRNTPAEPVEAATHDAPAEPWAQPREWKSRRTQSEPAAPIPERPVTYDAPSGASPVGLDGYCPVELLKTETWVEGDPALAVEYEGRTYRMSGPAQHRAFRAHPERFAPVLSGFDPVLAAEGRGNVPGRTDASAVYEGRLYMFANPANLSRFRQSPKQYTKFLADLAR